MEDNDKNAKLIYERDNIIGFAFLTVVILLIASICTFVIITHYSTPQIWNEPITYMVPLFWIGGLYASYAVWYKLKQYTMAKEELSTERTPPPQTHPDDDRRR